MLNHVSMSQLVIITCPKCGKYFALKKEPDDPSVKVRCLACHEYTPYYELSAVPEPLAELDEPETVVTHPKKHLPVLKLLSDAREIYKLRAGRNVIGRLSFTSKADIQIGSSQMKHISREHALVEVKEEMSGYVCYFSLYKKEINDTFVSGKKVNFGDVVCLNSGDRLIFPDNVVLEFTIE